MAYKTPGVYVEELSLFPPSVAEVETAIPAFIGYTEKAIRNGEDLTKKPTRITSLLEYESFFGGDWRLAAADIGIKVDSGKNYAVSVASLKRFYLYESLRLFFDNGGGPCYIVSVGGYGQGTQPAKAMLEKGLAALEKYDEPTIIVVPDAAGLENEAEQYALQVLALDQCGKLQDRVALLDVRNGLLAEKVPAIRDAIGTNNLKYGAVYGPWLRTIYEKSVPFSVLQTQLKDEADKVVDLAKLSANPDHNELVVAVQDAAKDAKTVADKVTALCNVAATMTDRFNLLKKAVRTAADDAGAKAALGELVAFPRAIAVGVLDWRDAQNGLKGKNLRKTLDAEAAAKLKSAVDRLVALEKNASVEALLGRKDADVEADYGTNKYDLLTDDQHKANPLIVAWISKTAALTDKTTTDYAKDANGGAVAKKNQAIAVAADLAPIFGALVDFVTAVEKAAASETVTLQETLYATHPIIGNIVAHIKRELSAVPPGGAVAGVYARIDATRGVWKAPANVSLSQVLGPVEAIDDAAQRDLNVDVVAGKSINAIRAFTGRGTMVWGARTLAGNDNEWRYVPVRRFFNMVEESVKKSTAWAVFEPNASPLWTKVKGMVDNYLIQKWRDGALAGARPDDAFYVKVGLGQTMTAQDVLEGKMVVEIGLAVVRPAEFIILRFSHMLQKS